MRTSLAIDPKLANGHEDEAKSRFQLEQKAWHCYELSLSDRVGNEHTVQYRADARALAEKLLAMAPEHPPALNLLGRISLDEGFYESAEHYLQRALKAAPDDAGCCYSLGHVNLARGRYNEAVKHFTRSLDLAPGETRAATSLVYTFARQGNVVQAFNGYRELFRVHPNDPHVRAKLFEVARHIQADRYQPDLEKDLVEWLKLDQVDHDGMASLTASILRHKYRLDDPDAVIDLQDLAKDELLQLALGKLYFTSVEMEQFLILVRKQLLLHSLAGQFQDKALLKLAACFVMQASHNEHVYAIDDEEKDLVQGLGELLDTILNTGTVQPADVTTALLMYGMYEPLHRLKGNLALSKIALNRWPPYVRPIISHCVLSLQEELKVAQAIQRLTPIEDPVSRAVRQQYEANPYPRWLHLGFSSPTNYGRALEAELEGYRAPQFFNMGNVKILVAGAGTGRHALHVAKYFRNVEVTAIDLSARSLAYAKRMAERYKIANIRFLQADILELDKLDEQFHVIECSGVLHHMADPEVGLAMLKQRLEPYGLLKIGLYSKEARRIVTTARQWIKDLDYKPTLNDIRRFRENLLEDRLEGDFKPLLSSRDFYSTSGCRDLLFHVQEHCFTPRGLVGILHRHELTFLGFIASASTKQLFKKTMGQSASIKNLNAWHRFEQQYPDTFAGMYQFYVQQDR